MDQAQNNFNTTYAQKEREQQFKYQKYWETERPQALFKIEQIREQIIKLKDDNEMNAATKEKRLEKAQKELDYWIDDFDYRETHDGMGRAEDKKFKADEKHKRNTESLGWANHNESVRYHDQKLNGSKYEIMSTEPGFHYNPNAQQIESAYRYLQGRHFVTGKAQTTAAKLAELQNYYTTGRNQNKGSRGKNRVDDTEGGPVVDAMLGGRTAITTDDDELDY